MGEKVKVRQNNKFEIQFWGPDPQDPESHELEQIIHIHELTPYGMMLASLGSCTTIVLHTYAQNHDIDLQEVEISLEYERAFVDESELHQGVQSFHERIQEQIELIGEFSSEQRKKLFNISKQCSIHKMYEHGVEIHSKLLNGA